MKKIWLAGFSAAALTIAVPGLASASGNHSARHRSYVSPAAASPGHKLVRVHPVHAFQARPVQTSTKFSNAGSLNWSGFVAYGDHFRYVNTTYTIPSVNCSTSPDGAFDLQLAGIDGWTSNPNPTVEEIGTIAQCSGGTPSYGAWYDMYPRTAVEFTGVSPGDSITVTVFYNSSAKDWGLTLHDNTTHAAISAPPSTTCPAGHNCQKASAEVISEGPGGNPQMGSLADYGTVGFTQVGITDTAGHHGNFLSRYWKNDKIYEVDPSGTEMQSPSPLEGSESGSGGGYGNQAFTDRSLNSN